jgi:putative membrane protein
MTLEQYEQGVKDGTIPQATQDYLNNAVDQYMASLTDDQINAAVDAAMESDDVKKLIADNVEAQIVAAVNEHMNDAEPQAKLSAASEGFKKVSALKTSLDDYNKFYQGLLLYTSKVSEAAQGAAAIAGGAAELKAGTSQLAAGASEFYQKFTQFQSGAGALTDGVSQLKDGAMQLTDGLKQLNEEGIQKLVDAVDGDLGKLAARAKATLDVSRDYKSFAGISDEMDGSVRFIYKTDEIKKSDN